MERGTMRMTSDFDTELGVARSNVTETARWLAGEEAAYAQARAAFVVAAQALNARIDRLKDRLAELRRLEESLGVPKTTMPLLLNRPEPVTADELQGA